MGPRTLGRLQAIALSVLVALSSTPLDAWAAAPEPAAATPQTLPAASLPWPQFGVTPEHSFAYTGPGQGFPDALLKWRVPVAASSSSSAVANFSSTVRLQNTSAAPDVMGVAYATVPFNGVSSVQVVAGNNGSLMWAYPFLGAVFAAPVLGDLNGDNKIDLIARSDSGRIEALSPNITWDGSSYSFPVLNITELQAQQLWNVTYSGDQSTDNNASVPILVDFLNDGRPEVLAPAGDRLYLLNGQTGAELANATVQGAIVSAPTAFRTSGSWRILVASWNFTSLNGTAFAYNFTVSSFDSNLNPTWSLTFPQTYDPVLLKSVDLQYPSPAVGALDGLSARDDIAVVTPTEDSVGRLRIFNNGTASMAVNLSLAGMTGSAPAVADLDGDGHDEVVVLSYAPGRPLAQNSSAFVEVFNGNGTRKWNATIDEFPGSTREHTLAPPALADFNGDGVLDVVAVLTDGSLEVRSGTNGTRLLRTTLLDAPGATDFSGPCVADLDGDSYLDITASAGAVSYALADLAINESDVGVTPAAPEQFENVTASATVHNTGNTQARNVTVRFMDGATVLNETLIPLIVGGFAATAQVGFNFSQGGARTLRTVVDWNDTITELNESNNEAVVIVNVSSRYGFHLDSPANRSAVQPGFGYVFIANAFSDATQTNLVRLTLGPLPGGWTAALNPGNLTLAPQGTSGDSNTSFLSVTTSAASQPGEYDILLTGTSANDSRNTANFTFTVIIGGQFGVSLFPHSAAANVTAGDQIFYAFNVINAGNSNDTFFFNASAPPPGWVALPSVSSRTLSPNQNMTVYLFVGAPTNATQGENATVTLTVRSAGNPARNETATTLTTVVVPDLFVSDIRFYRECGGEATGGVPHLVEDEFSLIEVDVENLAANTAISSASVRVTIDGTPTNGVVSIPQSGPGVFSVSYKFTTPGVKVVTAQVDPGNFVSELNELNNDRTEQATVKDASPVGDFTIQGWVLSSGAPVPSANVTASIDARGTNLSVLSAGDGRYSLTLTSGEFLDGDRVNVTATDGLDIGRAVVCAYSEDGSAMANVTLQLPSPFDFLLLPVGPQSMTALSTAPARYAVQLINRGPYNNTIALTPGGTWNIRILDSNNVSIAAAVLPPNGTFNLTVEVTPPANQARGDLGTSTLSARDTSGPQRTRTLSFNTTVAVMRALAISGPATADVMSGNHTFLNFTVTNNGNGADNITVAYTDLNSSAAAFVFSQSTAQLAAGGSVTIELAITAGASAPGGSFLVDLAAQTELTPVARANYTLSLHITAVVYAFEVTGPLSILVKPNEIRTTVLILSNTGTVPDTYAATATQPGGGITVRLLDAAGDVATSWTLAAGESAQLTVEVSLPRAVDRESFDIEVGVSSAQAIAPQTFAMTAIVGNVYDFQISRLTFTQTPSLEEPTEIRVVVENVGSRDFLGALLVTLKIEGTKVGNFTITQLNQGASQTVAFTWTPRIVGAINISVEVNPADATPPVFEASFAENTVSRTVQVQPQRPTDVLTQLSTYFVIAFIVTLVAILAAAVRRKEDDGQNVEEAFDQEAEELQERRIGRGPGGLGKI